jgi:hypothetical protein
VESVIQEGKLEKERGIVEMCKLLEKACGY